MSENIHGFNYEKDADGIVTITMDMDGPVNSMNVQFRNAMKAVADKLEAEAGLTGVVIASAKKTFFAGGDLKELSSIPKGEEESAYRMIEDELKAPLRRWEKLQVPVVAAINGAALGGGLEICLACNRRIAWDSPKVIIGLPEVTLGLLPGAGGVVRSIHMLGLVNALPLLLEGARMPAAKAAKVGYVDELVANAEDLVPAAKAWIKANPEAWAQPWDVSGHKIPGGDVWNPVNGQTLSLAVGTVFKKTRGLLPAPEQILQVASEAMCSGFESAMRQESRGLAYLLTTKEAKNTITAGFFQMNAVNGGAARPKDVAPSEVKKLGILGAGMMGQGIAYSAATAGIQVVLKDISVEAAEKGKAYSAKLLGKQVEKGRMTAEDQERVLGLITPSADYADLAGCDLIVEAVFENKELKAQVTKEAEAHLGEGVVFGSNTSSLPISELAEASVRPDNFIGIHFFSPVDKMPLVEIIMGEKTSDEALAKAIDFTRQIRKTPIVVNDSLGFFTTRVFVTYLDEGVRLLKEGLSPVLIDNMGKYIGMAVGPLTVYDEISQELIRKMAATHREMGVFGAKMDYSVATEVAETMVNEFGRGGRHHGGGFFEYGDVKQPWGQLAELYGKEGADLPQADMQDRLLFRQVIETLKCLQEGVLRSVAEGNVGSMLGIAAPAWTGGFIQVVNTYEYNGEIGIAAFIARAKELEAAYGERFAVPAILSEKLAAGELLV
ncbi:3-hydroxyacyl-CoA dehydrogenase NAD-binding domain-containing protein [Pseudomaricurvus sp. HS19]|uniref:3-hydroxyacyl-CoA dehydrogenase NAD-binding domain-containing protein n=1 Tax=Pseudomaricurvus sp. HS19 TaxID=2692626 RepID=UPI00136C58DC|nr:3-hydroxyacyl-CoA dehydrogenase NAD-binding domain-containing protein [Pseudomaricurvus sp. HS19]